MKSNYLFEIKQNNYLVISSAQWEVLLLCIKKEQHLNINNQIVSGAVKYSNVSKFFIQFRNTVHTHIMAQPGNGTPLTLLSNYVYAM